MVRLKEKISTIYYNFFPSFIEIETPSEIFATCDNCTFQLSNMNSFYNTKCCSYHPNLSNYLVGGILSDNTNAIENGKERIQNKIKTKLGISPYGILRSYKYAQLWNDWYGDEKPRSQEFVDSMVCPYYDNGNCTIWKYRENLCSTFFCHSIGGNKGKQFWNTLNQYLKLAERELTIYTMLKLGWDRSDIEINAATPEVLKIDDANGQLNEKRYRQFWKDWYGKEEEFYIECFRIITNLDTSTFQKIIGHTGELLEESLLKKLAIFKENIIPEYLQLNPSVKTELIDKNTLNVIGEKGIESISKIEFNFFKLFDGKRTTNQVIREAAKFEINITNLIPTYTKKGILIQNH